LIPKLAGTIDGGCAEARCFVSDCNNEVALCEICHGAGGSEFKSQRQEELDQKIAFAVVLSTACKEMDFIEEFFSRIGLKVSRQTFQVDGFDCHNIEAVSQDFCGLGSLRFRSWHFWGR
jgi:hypothetical protein